MGLPSGSVAESPIGECQRNVVARLKGFVEHELETSGPHAQQTTEGFADALDPRNDLPSLIYRERVRLVERHGAFDLVGAEGFGDQLVQLFGGAGMRVPPLLVPVPTSVVPHDGT
jgi:hypothetical protein